MKTRLTPSVCLLTLCACAGVSYAQQSPQNDTSHMPSLKNPSGSQMMRYETPYYWLFTDLAVPDVREADLRMTRMFEEYQRRTAGFAGAVKSKFPFYLYKNESDYNAAGGPKGSAGVYIEEPGGNRLMAEVGSRTSMATWHVLQHEGFHQFAGATINHELPAWLNEGMAEYFGESLWTGDGFVTGLIPPDRLNDIRGAIRNRSFKPFDKMMMMTSEEWGNKLEYSNYDQAWSMVQFLAHGDNGKYQQPFVQYMTALSKGQAADKAWIAIFGKDTGAFEVAYAKWWMSLPDYPTQIGYMQAIVQTETSFFARAYIMRRQQFTDLETFFKNYQPPDNMDLSREAWLPPKLFADTSQVAMKSGMWTLEAGAGLPKIHCEDAEGNKYVSTFAVNNGIVTQVNVNVTPAPPKR